MIRLKKNELINICSPSISLRTIFIIIKNFYGTKKVIYFNTFSYEIKLFSKFFGDNTVIKLIYTLTGLTLKKNVDSNSIPDYSNIQFDSMEQTTEIIDLLIPQLKNSKFYEWMSSLIGEEPAEAFILKNVSYYNLYPELLSINLCFGELNDSNKIIVVSEFIGLNKWIDIFQNKLSYVNVVSVKKNYFNYFVSSFHVFLVCFYVLFKFIFKRGLTFLKKPLKSYKFITEFIDPNKLNGGSYDADYFIDSNEIDSSNTIFFLTASQNRFLKSLNYNVDEIKNLFLAKNYNILVLDEVKYSAKSLLKIFKFFIYLIFKISSSPTNSIYNKTIINAWNEYLDFYSLFSSVSANSLLYYTFPNGRSSFRINDAMVTGFCRKSNIKSVGIQSRTIYSSKFEDSFDCFDRYLSWGITWDTISKYRTKYIKEVKHIGCMYIDDLKDKNIDDLINFKTEIICDRKFLITVFDGDISPHSHYTWNYSKTFILDVMKLANDYQDCQFVIKTKDISNVRLYLNNSVIHALYKNNNNITFIEKARNDYKKLINSSDIVISIEFTTPGFEALSLGKRIIYYSLIKNGGKAFEYLPNVISKNFSDLKNMFLLSKKDYKSYSKLNKDKILKLNYDKTDILYSTYLLNFK